jgi:hypothetical protein
MSQKITQDNETDDKISGTDMNVWDNARNAIKPMSFYLFHGQRNSTIYNWRYGYSSIRK